jgi:predicted transcriptional regulator
MFTYFILFLFYFSHVSIKANLDIMYEIDFVAQVLEGLKDAEKGKLLTTEELLDRVEQWAK